MRTRGLLAFLIVTACGGDPRPEPASEPTTGTVSQAVWVNGDFESDAIGTTPPTGWTLATNTNPGITDARATGGQTLSSLNLAAGGVAETFVVGGAPPESQTDPDVGATGTVRFPKYGARAARVNYTASTNTSTNGANKNVNSLTQQMTAGIGDVDPTDNKVHVRFAIAPVLENPTHAYTQQPYYFVRLQNITKGTTLYQDFNASGQTGVPWKDFTDPAGNAAQYTDWQMVDIAPGDTALAVGDKVELLVIAAGCSKGGHFGRVYVDSVGSGPPGLYAWATGPQQANAGTDITYTLNFKNGSTTTTSGTTLDLVTPPNTTFKSVSGATCTGPAVGATGTVSCSLGTLTPGTTGSYTLTVTVGSGVAANTVITNGNYQIYATGVNPLIGPKVQTIVTTGATFANLGISMTDGTTVIASGQPTTYTIVVSNAGPNTSTATVTDTMPMQLSGVTWTCAAAGGATCAAAGSGNISDSVSLPMNATATYTVNATVSGTGSVSNTATVAATGGTTDPDTSNNSAVDTDTIGTPRTMTLSKSGTTSAGTIASTPAALTCGTGCSSATGQFADGTQVMLTATPVSGGTFISWGGACASAGTATTCTLTMTGNQSVTASFAGPATATTTLSGTPQTAQTTAAYAAPLVVKVTDASGTPVPGMTVTFAPPSTGASATVSATTVVTDINGLASVTANANATAGAYTVTGSVSGIAPAASFALTNSGPPAAIAVSSGSAQSAVVTAAFASNLVAIVTDSSGRPVAGATVTFTAPSTGASATLGGATAVTDNSGLATVSATANTVSGSYAVTASVTGAGTPASFALTNSAGAATSLSVSSGNNQSATVNTAFAAPLVVKASDSFGNPVPGVAVTFTPPGTDPTAALASPTGTTGANGLAQTTATAGTLVGTYNVAASATGLTAVNFSLTNTAGAAAAIAVASGNNQTQTVRLAFAQALAVTVTDSFGNPVPGAAVTFTAPGTGASATVSNATTNSAGVASVPATANSVAGAYAVTASTTGAAAPASFALTNAPAAPAAVTFTAGGGQSATVGVAFAQQLAVLVVDADNNPVPNVTVTLAGPATGAGIATSPVTLTTGAAGTASTTAVTANHTAGAYSVSATVSGVATVPTVTLTNTAGAVTALTVVSGSGQHTAVTTGFTDPLVVAATDTFGNPVSGATVAFTAPASTGASAAFSAPTATTGSDGRAQVTATAGTHAGAYSVTASTTGGSTTFSLTNDPGAAAVVSVASGGGQSATVGTGFGAALVAHVTDAQGNDVPGVTVTFAAPATGAKATLIPTTATTGATGLAQTSATAGQVTGSYTITATATDVATPANFTVTNTPGAAALLAIVSGNNQSATVNTAFAAPLVVKASDSFGNPVPGVAVTFTPPSTGARAAVASPTGTTDASGQVQTTATAGTVSGSYSVAAGASGVSAINFSLTNAPGAAAAIAMSSGDNQTAAVHAAFAQPLVVTVTDSFGNPVSGAAVTFSAPGTGASATVSNATTNSAGVGSVAATANAVTGAYTVTASTTGAPASASFSLTNSAGPPATVAFTSGGDQSAAVGADFAQPLVVRVLDTDGNPVSGATVTLTGPATGAGIATSPVTLTTGAAGTASTTAVTANHTAGAYSVSATVSGVATVPTVTLTNTAGAVTALTVVSGSGQHAAVTTGFTDPLVVAATDTFGNPVSGATVAFTAPASTGASATLSAPTAVTGSNGRAQITATAGTHAGGYSVAASTTGGSTTLSLTNDPGAVAAISVVSGSDQSGTVATAFAAPLVVHVADAQGNDVPGVTVTFAAPGAEPRASLSSTTATTGPTGQAQITATAGQKIGNYAVTASAPGPASPVSFSLTNTAGAVATLTATGGDGQSAVVLVQFTDPLTVHAEDAFGNPAANATVTFTAPATGASATFENGGTATTDASGNAHIAVTAGSVAGAYAAQATAGSAPALGFGLTNLHGDATQIAVVDGAPQSTAVATGFAAPLRAVVSDAQGNPVPGASVIFHTAFSGASAALSSPTATSGADGIVTVTAAANTVSGTYQVTASLSADVSAAFALTNLAGAPASIAANPTASPQQSTVLQPFSAPLAATVRDRYGNPVAGAMVTYSIPGAGATAALSAVTATTDANGVASVTAVASPNAGAYVARASVGGASDPAAFGLTNLAGAAASLVVISGDGQAATVNTSFATALVVQARDGEGNPVPSAVVSFSAPGSPATAVLAASSAMTDAAGRATVTATASKLAGSYLVTAVLPGALAPVTLALHNAPGAPATISPDPGSTPQNARVEQRFVRPLIAVVRDAFGNPVPGVSVTYAAPATPATGAPSATTATSDADGSVSIELVAGTVAGSYSITATVTGVDPPASFAMANLAGQPSSISFVSGSGQSAAVFTGFAAPLVVRVQDSDGNPVSGATVTFAAPSSGPRAAFGSATAITGSDGTAQTTATAAIIAGGFQVTASAEVAAGSTAAPALATLTALAGPPSTMTVLPTATPQTTQVGHAFALSLAVIVVDGFGNPVPGASVAFAGPSEPGALLSAGTNTTDANGVALVLAIADDKAGSYSVTAALDGTDGASFGLGNIASAPSKVVVTAGGSQSTLATTQFGMPVTARVIDELGNPVAGVPVTFSAPTAGPSATMSDPMPVSDADGYVSVSLTAGPEVGQFALSAQVQGAAVPAVTTLEALAIPTTTTATASDALPIDQPLEVTIAVGAMIGVPSGTIEIRGTDGKLYGSGTLSGGKAVVSVTGLSVGSHTALAHYPAQGSFGESASRTLSFELAADSGKLSGSGCSAGGSGPGAGWLVFAIAALAYARRPRQRWLAAAISTALWALLAIPGGVAAADGDPGGGRSINRYHAASPDSDWFELDSATYSGNLGVSLSAVADYAHEPLDIYYANDALRQRVVQRSLIAQLGASLTLFDKFRLSALVTMAPWQDGPGGTFNGVMLPVPTYAFGDITLTGDVRVVGAADSPFRVSVGAAFALPAGSREHYMSDDTLGFEPRGLIAGSRGRFEYAVEGSVFLRPTHMFAGEKFGNELRFGGAAGMRFYEGRLLVGPELFGTVPIHSDSSVGTPLEVDLGAHYLARSDMRLGLAGGLGVVNAPGEPAWRILASVIWSL